MGVRGTAAEEEKADAHHGRLRGSSVHVSVFRGEGLSNMLVAGLHVCYRALQRSCN